MLWFIHGHGYQDYGISSAFKCQLNKYPKYSTRSNHVLRVKYLLTQSLHLQPSTLRTPKTLSIEVNKGLYNRCKMSSPNKQLSQGIPPHIPPTFFSSKMLVISWTLTLGHGAVTISKLHLTRSQQGDVNIIEFPFSSH